MLLIASSFKWPLHVDYVCQEDNQAGKINSIVSLKIRPFLSSNTC